MPGAQPDLSSATYRIDNETHTLGNALRWMLMKKYLVVFSRRLYNWLNCPQSNGRILRVQVGLIVYCIPFIPFSLE